jgi:regulatory protein
VETLLVESVELGRNACTLHLSNGEVLRAGNAYLPSETLSYFLPSAGPLSQGGALSPGAALEPAVEAALRRAAECLSAEKAALRLIARAEQRGAGLARKLEQRKHPPEAVGAVLARLTELGLINDRRYAGLWLKSRINRGRKGPRALLAALQNRGIDRDDAEAALREALSPESEAALLRRLVEKAGRRVSGAPPARGGRGDQRYFLKNEGFSAAAIAAYLEEEGT